ncbi:MAG TPA: response regulator, partial [Pyrinomonadaceae bacterium]|nr:response regulator [Pyrinomonadaceae bacterium]
LGLATVYGIVKQSNGEITVESELGKGTTFKLYFPCVDKEQNPENKDKTEVHGATGNETILVIEDEQMVRELTRQILEAEGYNVISAENGKAALDIVEKLKGEIELVVTDVIMPEMSGIEFSRKVKEIYPELPILFTSGYSDDHSFFEELRDVKAMFLSKPFVSATLIGKVREFLDMKRK